MERQRSQDSARDSANDAPATVADAPASIADAVSQGDDSLHGARALPGFAPSTQSRRPEELATIGHVGRYALKYRIGEGGLGTVYAAHDPLLSRLIAVKTLNVDVPAEARQTFDALFLNEARAAGSLSHPHIVTVFDAGVSDQGPYIAMELLKGRDLRQLRQEGWRPSPAQTAMIVRRVADALGYAHAKGVVHRDIKPANIFMVGRTQPRVLDFGIARIAQQHDVLGDESITAGSPYYMAPEQLRAEPVDRRGDVFSLGVVFYEMLTGVRPFRGGTLAEISDAVLNHEPPPAHEVDVAVPHELSAICVRAMEKSPELRYRSARGMSRELRRWLDEHAQGADDVADVVKPKKPLVLWAALAGGVLMAVAGTLMWTTREPAAAPPQASVAAGAAALEESASRAPVTPPVSAVAAAPPVQVPAAPAAAPTLAVDGTASTKVADARTPAPKQTERRTTVKPREARPADAAAVAVAAPTEPAANGVVHIAVTPWGQIEVDGRDAGTAPPLNRLTLPEGPHSITIRNADFPPHTVKINVSGEQAVTLRHRF